LGSGRGAERGRAAGRVLPDDADDAGRAFADDAGRAFADAGLPLVRA
jgi:hypothetical protein